MKSRQALCSTQLSRIKNKQHNVLLRGKVAGNIPWVLNVIINCRLSIYYLSNLHFLNSKKTR